MLKLAIFVLLFLPACFVMGRAALVLLYGRRRQREFAWEDGILTGGLLVIGLAEGAHLGALLRGQSVSVASEYLFVLSAVAFVGSLAVWCIVYFRTKKETKKGLKDGQGDATGPCGRIPRNEKVLQGILLVIFLLQLAGLLFRTRVYPDYDLTLETVVTFLKEDRLYGSNPMTGFPYAQGIPSRLKILCLPTLYSVICRWTGCSEELLVYHVIPGLVLSFAYLAYASLGRALFPEQGFQRRLFLVFAAILFWVGDSMYGLEGFGLLHGGFQGTAIRGAVLMPWLFGLCLRRGWKLALGVIAAEACVVWTLYGAGMGAFTVCCYALLLLCGRRFFGRREEKK